ncbi:cypemycin family RiPP [uncultured Corynebacterium sp.]|uniref:cypemycin family RiPP n=1 Tax=uncultured Corynebacterium sp. TaxID=159447 RepID=UPI0035A65C8F
MISENLEVENFANTAMLSPSAGFATDSATPAMTTPTTPTAAQFVIYGSTICLIC